MSNRATLLEGPIAKQLLALSWPVLVVLALQTFVGVAETYFVSFLGTDALAGVALVFPVFMLMTMMSNGGIGGGVSSAVARAIGAGRRHDAQALAMHAVVVGSVFGAIFTIGVWAGGPALFTLMGGQGDTLANALLYANVLFLAAIPGWISNLLASALRGAGDVRVPAIVTAGGAVITLALSPLFIFGWGWVPRMGVAGAGLALICFNVGSVLVLALYMRSSRSPIRLAQARLEWRLFEDILKVGLLSAIGTVVARSEERRVGKECSSRWSPYHSKKKKSSTSTSITFATADVNGTARMTTRPPKRIPTTATDTSVTRGVSFFFFQAEDGIRDLYVTGVQTCALPI